MKKQFEKEALRLSFLALAAIGLVGCGSGGDDTSGGGGGGGSTPVQEPAAPEIASKFNGVITDYENGLGGMFNVRYGTGQKSSGSSIPDTMVSDIQTDLNNGDYDTENTLNLQNSGYYSRVSTLENDSGITIATYNGELYTPVDLVTATTYDHIPEDQRPTVENNGIERPAVSVPLTYLFNSGTDAEAATMADATHVAVTSTLFSVSLNQVTADTQTVSTENVLYVPVFEVSGGEIVEGSLSFIEYPPEFIETTGGNTTLIDVDNGDVGGSQQVFMSNETIEKDVAELTSGAYDGNKIDWSDVIELQGYVNESGSATDNSWVIDGGSNSILKALITTDGDFDEQHELMITSLCSPNSGDYARGHYLSGESIASGTLHRTDPSFIFEHDGKYTLVYKIDQTAASGTGSLGTSMLTFTIAALNSNNPADKDTDKFEAEFEGPCSST